MGFLAGRGASFLAGSAGFLAAQCREYRLPCFQLCWPDTAVPQEPAHATDHPVITLITLPAPVKVGFLTGRGAGFLAGSAYTQDNGGWRTAPPISITMLSNLVVRYFRPPGSGPCPRSPRHCTDHAGRARQSGLLNRPGSRLLSGFQQASWRTVQGTLTATHPFSLYL